MPSFKNLQYLVALKKTNHFSNAAKECYVSASTFSAGIAKLENEPVSYTHLTLPTKA